MQNKNNDVYFSNGKYDIYKSEKRRKEIKDSKLVKRKFPSDVNVSDFLMEKDRHSQDVAHRMMFRIFTQSKN